MEKRISLQDEFYLLYKALRLHLRYVPEHGPAVLGKQREVVSLRENSSDHPARLSALNSPMANSAVMKGIVSGNVKVISGVTCGNLVLFSLSD